MGWEGRGVKTGGGKMMLGCMLFEMFIQYIENRVVEVCLCVIYLEILVFDILYMVFS
jgi:hypothetical protein